jgi:ATP-dependent helicase HrpB
VDRWALQGHPLIREGVVVRWDAARERVVAAWERRFLDLVIEDTPVPLGDREAAAACLLEAAGRDVTRALAPDAAAEQVLARIAVLGRAMPELGLPAGRDEALRAVLPALCAGRSSLSDLRAAPLARALLEQLPYPLQQALREHAPEALAVPSGRAARLAYPPEGAPVLAVKVQELFGWTASPAVAAGRVPVVLHLLDPAGRPLQVTADLASFWGRTWPEVRREMRARYPKHRWPEDPLRAEPSVRTTKRR